MDISARSLKISRVKGRFVTATGRDNVKRQRWPRIRVPVEGESGLRLAEGSGGCSQLPVGADRQMGKEGLNKDKSE